MNPVAYIIIGCAFPLSVAIAFFSRRFSWGFLFPIACLALYLLLAAFHATGWKPSDLGLPLAFSIALMLAMGLPMSVITALGAWLGVYLSKRIKTTTAPVRGDCDR